MFKEIIKEISDHIIVAIIIAIGSGLLIKRKLILRQIKSWIYRNYECRISFACLLIVKKHDKYLLIRNVNRPEVFGPIGGVYKYFETAKPFLNATQFRQHQIKNTKTDNDLRGFIPMENLNKFYDWFEQCQDREIESITREFKEELTDILLIDPIIYEPLKFRLFKKLNEGPYFIKEKGYVQFRHLDIYELIPDKHNDKLIDYLLKKGKTNKNLIWATAQEIRQRRMSDGSKNIIGSYCGFLINSKRTSIEDTPY